MQIKTIGCITIGLGLGWLAFTEPKTKEKACYVIKKILYKWQTGKDLNQVRKPINSFYRPITYKSYADRLKEKEKEKYNKPDHYDIPNFDTKESAEEFLILMKNIADNFKAVSIYDMYSNIKEAIPYTYDNWGWYSEDLENVKVDKIETEDKEKWTLIGLCPARNLYN